MDEFHDNDRLRSALDAALSGLNGDPWRAQRVLAKSKGQEKVKRKISIGLIFAIIATIALMGVAIAPTINLFEQFGQTDQRFAQIAPQTNIDVMTERTILSPMTATVGKLHCESVMFMGFETVKGVQIGLTIQASEVHLSAKIVATEAELPNIPDDSWFDLQLLDETGYEFSPTAFEMQDDRTLLFTFNGNGRTPITLDAYLLVVSSSGENESTHIPVDING